MNQPLPSGQGIFPRYLDPGLQPWPLGTALDLNRTLCYIQNTRIVKNNTRIIINTRIIELASSKSVSAFSNLQMRKLEVPEDCMCVCECV